MRAINILILVSFIFVLNTSFGSEEQKKEKDAVTQDAHGDSDGHKHNESEDGEEESAGSVGPDKGIIAFSEREGFQLSPEALRNFDLKYLKLTGAGPWTLNKNALFHSGEETNLYRKRKGFFKRIDFQTIRKTENQLTVDSDDLREGDEVVIDGLGFLRIAELAASGGVSDSHAH